MDIKDYFSGREVAAAFSGGVDSAVLRCLAKKYAKRVKAYYAKSQFQPQFELDDVVKVAKALGAELEVIPLDVLAYDDVTKNPANRCYYCKKRIFTVICAASQNDGFDIVCDGTNATDDADDRPGFKALGELGVESPLRAFGYTKSDIRQIARDNRLAVADKCSYACLATRIPTGTAISADVLAKTERAEDILRTLGFNNFRVRYLDGAAKLELSHSDFALLFDKKDEVYKSLCAFYSSVYLDLKERYDE